MVVLGVNTFDKKHIVEQNLARYELEFPNIHDTSPEAMSAMRKYETIGMSAAPLTYLIDRTGNVLDAWYGYDANKTDAALAKLKLGDNE